MRKKGKWLGKLVQFELLYRVCLYLFVNPQLRHLGIEWTDYDITVVKQGYIFPDFKAQARFYVMSLTDGATPQDTASIPFKRIMRPMFPIDQI